MKKDKLFFTVVISICVTGVILRLLFIGKVPPSLYIDEINDLVNAQNWIKTGSILNVSFTGLRISLFQILSGNAFAALFLGFNVNVEARFSVLLYSVLISLPLYKVSNELFGGRTIGYVSVLFWLFSPLSFFMSLDATSLELMPLFYLLTFVFFVLKLRNNNYVFNRYWIYLFAVLFFIFIIRDNMVWSFIDLIFIILILIFYESFSREGIIRQKFSLKKEILLLSSIVLTLSLVWFLFIGKLSSYFLSPSLNLALLPFNQAARLFFIRLYYFVKPQNMILLNAYPSSVLRYPPSITPIFFLSEGLVFYPAIGYSLFSSFKRKNTFRNIFLLSMIAGGYSEPILSLANPPNFAVQAETIFAFPAFVLLISAFLIELVRSYSKLNTNNIKRGCRLHKKTLVSIIAFLMILMMVNIGGFLVDISSHYDNYASDNIESQFYPFYGLKQSADYIVSHNLVSYPLFYYPNTSYNNWVNLTTNELISYWFYTEGYPLQYLNEYSHGKIGSIKLIYPGTFPVVGPNGVVVLSQNFSYSTILSDCGYSTKILYNVSRPDKTIAWQIIEVTPILPAASGIINSSTILTTPGETNMTFGISVLRKLDSNFAVATIFNISDSRLKNDRFFPLFRDSMFLNIGLGNGTNFPYLSPIVANGTVAYLELKMLNSSYIKYVATTTDIMPKISYFLFVTFNAGQFYFYLNNTLLSAWSSSLKFTWTPDLYLTSSPSLKSESIIYTGYATSGIEDSIFLWESSRSNE